MAVAHSKTIRTKRINLRATDRQEKLIRTGAETSGLSVTDFILDSACLQAEQVLADKGEFIGLCSFLARSREAVAFQLVVEHLVKLDPALLEHGMLLLG
jgi:hypothetical protein